MILLNWSVPENSESMISKSKSSIYLSRHPISLLPLPHAILQHIPEPPTFRLSAYALWLMTKVSIASLAELTMKSIAFKVACANWFDALSCSTCMSTL
jgi:hypothetical protein